MKPKTWTHPKFIVLQRRLGVCPALAAGILEGIWHLAATFDCEGGKLPFTDDELAAWLGVDIAADELVDALTEGRWLDLVDNCLVVHGWEEHRPEYIAKRVREKARYEHRQKPADNGRPAQTCAENGRPEPICVPSASASASASPKPYLVQGSKSSQGEPGPPGPEMGGEKKTKPRNGSKALPKIRTAVTAHAIADQAAAIFDACHYSGDDGGNLWGVAALLETDIGELSESEVYSACRGAQLNGRDKPKHFFACLAESVAKRGYDLTQCLRKVNILPEWPTTKDGRRIERAEKVRA